MTAKQPIRETRTKTVVPVLDSKPAGLRIWSKRHGGNTTICLGFKEEPTMSSVEDIARSLATYATQCTHIEHAARYIPGDSFPTYRVSVDRKEAAYTVSKCCAEKLGGVPIVTIEALAGAVQPSIVLPGYAKALFGKRS